MAKNFKTGVTVDGNAKGAIAALNLTSKGLGDLNKKAKATENGFKKFSKSMVDGLGKAASQAAKYGSIAAGAITATGAAMVKSGLSSVDALAKTSDKLGVTTEALARLRFAAEQTGVTTQTMDMALQRMTRRVAEAARGTGEAVGALQELGISAADIAKQSPDQMFREITKAMGGVETQSDKVRLAMKLFDSEGVSLVNTMKGGASALDELAAQADAAGLSISRLDAAKVEAANDAMNRVQSIFTAMSQHLAVKFAPILEAIADRMFGIGVEAGGAANAATKAFNHMVKAAGVFANGIRGIQIGWYGMKLVIQEVGSFILRYWDWLVGKMIDIWNNLPMPTDIPYTSIFRDVALSVESDMEDTRARLDELLMKPLPSQAIDEFVVNTERAFEASVVAGRGMVREFTYMTETTQSALQERLLKARESFAKSHSELNKLAKKDAEENADGLAVAYERGLERIDDGFADFFKGILRDGKVTFDSLKNIFLDTLGEMIYAAARNKIMLSIAMGGSGTALASGGGGAGGTGSATSLTSLFTGGVTGLYQGAGNLLSNMGLTGLGDAAYNTGLRYGGGTTMQNFTNMGLDLAGGLAGSFLGNKVFGKTSGIGSTLGGMAGTLIPIPVLGPAIGSFLGAGIESLFTSKPSDKRQVGQLDLNDLSRTYAGSFTGKKFSQENRSAVDELLSVFAQTAQSIGGSTGGIEVSVGGRTGIKVLGQEVANATEALEVAWKTIISGANNLAPPVKTLAQAFQGGAEQAIAYTQSMQGLWQQTKINPVTQAIDDFAAAQGTAYSAYRGQADTLRSLVSEFDGSTASATQLTQALAGTQQVAYQLTQQFLQAQQQIGQAGEASARSIREAAMTEQQLRQSLFAQRKELRESFATLTDPGQLQTALQEALQINQRLFQMVEDPTAEQAERFASTAESLTAQADRRIDRLLKDTRQEAQQQNAEIRELLRENAASQAAAAERQDAASSKNLAAAERFAAAVAAFQSGAGGGYFIDDPSQVTG